LSSSYTKQKQQQQQKKLKAAAEYTHTHTLTRTSPHTRIQIHLYTSWHVSLSTRKRECDSHTRWSQCEKERKREYESECVENCLSGNNNKNGHRCDWWGAHLCLDADWRKSCCVPIAFSLSAAFSAAVSAAVFAAVSAAVSAADADTLRVGVLLRLWWCFKGGVVASWLFCSFGLVLNV